MTFPANRYCFCLTEDDPPKPFFPLACSHAFHRSCLRQMLRSAWKRQVQKTVDAKGRRVAELPCPLCRRPLSSREVADLQTQTLILRFDAEFPESDEEAAHAEGQAEPESTVSERHGSGNPPEIRTDTPRSGDDGPSSRQATTTTRLPTTDLEVTATSPSSLFRVSVRSEEPTSRTILEFEAEAGDLPSLEDDAEEERAQERQIALLRRRGELAVLREDGTLERSPLLSTNEAFAPPPSPPPPLPSVESVSVPPPDSRASVSTPRPPLLARRSSTTARDRPTKVRRGGKQRGEPPRQTATEEEKREKALGKRRRSEKKVLDRIKGNLKNTRKTVETLHKNIRAWRDTRENARSRSRTGAPGGSTGWSIDEADRDGGWSTDRDEMVDRSASLCEIVRLFGDLFEEDAQAQ